jgi:hypothetical protein
MLKPLEVKALPRHRIWIRYSVGSEGIVDLSDLAGRGVFALWKQSGVFEKVHIGPCNAISWTEQVELCPDSVYLKLTGKSPEDIFPRLRSLRKSA